ncbi:MAG: flagellin [Dehalobacterium sp.]
MRINTNTSAATATRYLNNATNSITKNMSKLSSGLRITNAADDATGLVISEQMKNQIKGFDQAIKNAEQASAMLSTAEGALGQQEEIVSRIRELVVGANTGNMNDANKKTTQDEIDKLLDQIKSIADQTAYNTKKLLNVSGASGAKLSLTFQIGANAGEKLEVDIMASRLQDLGKVSGYSATDNGLSGFTIMSGSGATAVGKSVSDMSGLILSLDEALKNLSENRATLGATINRLDYTVSNLEVSKENLDASKSLITDVDMADEYVNMSTNQILEQVSMSMLSQANQKSQSILTLLQG